MSVTPHCTCGHTEAAHQDTPAGDWPCALCHCPDYVHDPHLERGGVR